MLVSSSTLQPPVGAEPPQRPNRQMHKPVFLQTSLCLLLLLTLSSLPIAQAKGRYRYVTLGSPATFHASFGAALASSCDKISRSLRNTPSYTTKLDSCVLGELYPAGPYAGTYFVNAS